MAHVAHFCAHFRAHAPARARRAYSARYDTARLRVRQARAAMRYDTAAPRRASRARIAGPPSAACAHVRSDRACARTRIARIARRDLPVDMAAPDPPSFTALQVAKHNQHHDAWIIVAGKVLNVTPYLHEHPGGDVVLLDSAGRDATRDFEDVGHSPDANAQLERLVIGVLRPQTADELRVGKKGAASGARAGVHSPASAFAEVSSWLRANAPTLTHVAAATAALLAAVLVARRYVSPSSRASRP
eukprot:IDg15413t1